MDRWSCDLWHLFSIRITPTPVLPLDKSIGYRFRVRKGSDCPFVSHLQKQNQGCISRFTELILWPVWWDFNKNTAMLQPRRRSLTFFSRDVLPPHLLKSTHVVDPKQGQNKADRSHSFTGIRSKIQLIVVFVGLNEVHNEQDDEGWRNCLRRHELNQERRMLKNEDSTKICWCCLFEEGPR